MGFANVGLLTLSEGNSAGEPFCPGASDLDVLEVKPSRRVLLGPALRGRTHHKLAPRRRLCWHRMRRRRPRLRLARYGYGDLPVVHPHREVRHQRTFNVADHLFRRELSRSQNMDLLDRATLALNDLRGDYSRERKDQLLGSLDRKYAAGDVVQIQFVRRELDG